MKRVYRTLLLLVTAIVALGVAKAFFDRYIVASGVVPEPLRSIYIEYRVLVDLVLVVAAGALSIQVLSTVVYRTLSRTIGREAHTIRNIVVLTGYIVLGLVVAGLLGVGAETLFASATFSGLVVGLSLGPVLSNFFSGLLILATGYLRPGRYVKIGGAAPVNLLAFPAYKFFSRDHILPVLKGTVLEVGLLYTKIVSVDGELVKISNSALLNNGVVVEEYEETRHIQVRYEFPITCDPGTVTEALGSRLARALGHDGFSIYIEEQSDKNYYIVLVTSRAPPERGVRESRSQVLREMIEVHRDLLARGLCREPGQALGK